MATTNRRCPKCHNEMVAGLIIDVADKGPIQESVVEPNWVAFPEGEVERTGWPPGYIKNLEGRDRRTVSTYRCVGCDYLESFAGPIVQS